MGPRGRISRQEVEACVKALDYCLFKLDSKKQSKLWGSEAGARAAERACEVMYNMRNQFLLRDLKRQQDDHGDPE